jgi:hypothetical protein
VVCCIGIVSQPQRTSAGFIQAAKKRETIYKDHEGHEYELSQEPDLFPHVLKIPSNSAPSNSLCSCQK